MTLPAIIVAALTSLWCIACLRHWFPGWRLNHSSAGASLSPGDKRDLSPAASFNASRSFETNPPAGALAKWLVVSGQLRKV